MTFEAVACPEVSTSKPALFSPKDPCHAAQWQKSPMIHQKNSISTWKKEPCHMLKQRHNLPKGFTILPIMYQKVPYNVPSECLL